jgi:hypothetical protein
VESVVYRRGELVLPELQWPYVCGLGLIGSQRLKKLIVDVVDYHLDKAMEK